MTTTKEGTQLRSNPERNLFPTKRLVPWRLLVVLVALSLVAVACGDDDDDTSSTVAGDDTSSTAAAEDTSSTAAAGDSSTTAAEGEETSLEGASFTVGSKEFTEQLILGQITIQVLENAGAEVDDQTGLVGSEVVREALSSGDIDMYWEYTGTGWINHLGNTDPVEGEEAQYEAIRDADAENEITWLTPAPFNDTYAIAVASERAEDFGVTQLSDLAGFAESNPDDFSLCAAAEFLGRDDGLPGLQEAYGFDFGDQVSEVEFGVIFISVDEGDPCIFGEVFATDARILSLDLTVLEDDQDFFPVYQASLNVRTEVFEENPGLEELFAPIAEALDDEAMVMLNAGVDVDGGQPEDVVRDWLVAEGFVSG